MEVGEQSTAELWASFGGWRCSVERARARRSEPDDTASAVAEFQCEKGEREGMDASRSSRAMPWRSCKPSALTSGARYGVWSPNVAQTLSPVGHVDGDYVHLELVFKDSQRYFGADYLPNRGKLGDGVIDTLGVLAEFYKFVDWSKDQFGLDEKIWGFQKRLGKLGAPGLSKILLSVKTAPKSAL